MFTSFTLVMLSALIIAIAGLLYVRKSHADTLRRREIRRRLLKQVESLPLPKMMKALGIGIRRFFHELPADTIKESITLCETCNTRTECAEKLKRPELNPDDVKFCRNQAHLKPFSREQRINKQNSR